MRRILAAVALLSAVLLIATGYSRAQVASPGAGCSPSTGPSTACPVTLVPTVPLNIEKSLAVSGGVSEPLGVTDYTVKVTSRVACFSLGEPIDVATFGNPDAAALSPATPGSFPVQNPNFYQIQANDQGEASLMLEVAAKFVGPEGLAVKAVWPLENVEHVVQVVQPATPTATPVGTPAVDTPTPVPTDTETPGPTPTATPSGTFTLETCLTPSTASPGGGETLYVRTLPGALCSVSVLFDNGVTADSLGGGLQEVGPVGIAAFPFTVDNTGASMGLATATCTFQGQTLSQDQLFNIG